MTFKTIPITLFLFLANAAQLIPSLAMATSNIHSSNIYSTHNEMIWEDFEGDYEQNLIHIPLRSRYSVLRERNLLHLIEQDADLDTTFMYLRWATSRNEGGAGNHRALQNEGAYAGEGTHFIDVFVGNPAQKRILAVSSGADFTAFPCQVRSFHLPFIFRPAHIAWIVLFLVAICFGFSMKVRFLSFV